MNNEVTTQTDIKCPCWCHRGAGYVAGCCLCTDLTQESWGSQSTTIHTKQTTGETINKTKRGSDGRDHPVIPPLPHEEPNLDPNPIVSICGECGLEIRKIMMYSCQNSRCPVQPRTTC